MGVRDNFHVVRMALFVELECTFHGHAMNPFRMLHQLCKYHSTSHLSSLRRIRSPDGFAICRVGVRWPQLQRRDYKQRYDRLRTHRSNENYAVIYNPYPTPLSSLPENTATRQPRFQGQSPSPKILWKTMCHLSRGKPWEKSSRSVPYLACPAHENDKNRSGVGDSMC